MTKYHRMLRLAASVLVAVGLLRFVGCGDDGSVVMPPKGGGKRPNPYSCFIGPAQNSFGSAFSNARVSGSFSQGLQSRPNGFGCPYIVDYELERINIGVQMTEPRSTINQYDTRVDFTGLHSKWTGAGVAPANAQYWANDPNNVDGVMVEFAETYTAAALISTSPPMDFAYDSGFVEMTTIFGHAQGRVILAGGVAYHTAADQSSLDVPPLSTLYPSTIRAIPQVDTNSYGWSWQVDGAIVNNPDARLTTTLMPGYHTVKALAQLSDLTVDTIHATVYSQFSVSVSGETAPAANSATEYAVNIGMGTAPFAIRWFLDGSQIATDPSVTLTFAANAQHTLSASVVDANGYGANAALIIQAMDGNAYSKSPGVHSTLNIAPTHPRGRP